MELTIREAAKLLKVTEGEVYGWIEEGGLPACKVGGLFHLNREELIEWATAAGIRISPEILSVHNEKKENLPSVAEALEKGGVFFNVQGKNKRNVLEAVVKQIRLPKHVQRDFLLQVLLAREAMGSTGIGDGIAIPHPRNPIVLNIVEPLVSLHFLKKPVDFEAMDGKPVDTLFMIISPTIQEHLQLLSRLAFVLHEPSFKAVLKRRKTAGDILAEMKKLESAIRLRDARAKGK